MRRSEFLGTSRLQRLLALLLLAVLVGCDTVPQKGNTVPNTPDVPTPATTVLPAPTDGIVELPPAVGTPLGQLPVPQPQPSGQPPSPIPFATMTWPVLPDTPTPVMLQPAVALTPRSIATITAGLAITLTDWQAITMPDPLVALTWAPTGDKIVYVTSSGKLYWSNLDGTSATFLYDYGETFYGSLDQMPLSNTLFIRGHILQFTPGQAPVLRDAPLTSYLWQLRWWQSDRASGVASISYVPGGYVGGDKLVTVDASGNLVEARNIPYMQSGAVQPGGEWLAYATSQQATDTPFYGSDPETVYLLNLHTGQRWQVTTPGMGFGVGSWSPDGNWFYMGADIDHALRGVLVSADGQEWIPVTTPPGTSGYDAVWSPDSKRLAYSVELGGCEEPGCVRTPVTSTVYIVDILARKFTEVIVPGASQGMRPAWSPDGSRLLLLAFDPHCHIPAPCSGTAPAFYNIAVSFPP